MLNDEMLRIKRLPLEYSYAYDIFWMDAHINAYKKILVKLYAPGGIYELSNWTRKKIYYSGKVLNKNLKFAIPFDTDSSTEKFDAILIETENPEIIEKLDRLLADNGRLYILIPNPLLGIYRGIYTYFKIKKMLKKYEIAVDLGLHSPKSYFMSFIGLACKVLGRPDLQDRFHYHGFRTAFLDSSRFRILSPLLLLIAFKGGGE